MTDTADYKSTVFLPSTPFPMRGDLPTREPAWLERWDRIGLWQRTTEAMQGRPRFVLHDGPIYSNGNLHIGHALNRILKDVIMRAHRMAGENVPYIPGWDTHGLPIEWKVEEEYRKTGRDKDAVPVLDFRDECRRYSQHWLDVQTAEFKRLGVEGDWARRYATFDFGSEAAIAAEIGKFLLNGALYRGLRPVMWSPVEKTALAEAEVEYHDRNSDTVFVRFPLISAPNPLLEGAAAVIWTTTTWTLPSNRAIAYGPTLDYALIQVDSVADGSLAQVGERLLIALGLLDEVAKAAGITDHHVEQVFSGTDLEGAIARHPLRGQGYDHDVRLLPADYVTIDQGTGLVHTAPSHGVEDFVLGREYGLEVPETVQGDGTYSPWVPLFAGVHVFKASKPVSDAIEAAGGLLARGTLLHSYPHSWRSKAPVIYRATPQWFIALDDDNQIRTKAMAALAETRFVPESGRTRLTSMVANRPDWCISRQRAWGVPIPVFVERRSGEPLRDPAVLERIVGAFEIEGADAWYSSPPERFLGPDRDPSDYEQVMDIVDVWFESASPTPPNRENQASRAKSNPPGLAGPGGGSRIARRVTASPGSISAGSRKVSRSRTGNARGPSPAIAKGCISSRRRPPAASVMSTTRPLTRATPSPSGMTGPRVRSVASLASVKPSSPAAARASAMETPRHAAHRLENQAHARADRPVRAAIQTAGSAFRAK